MDNAIPSAVRKQLDKLSFRPERPLIVSDADGVLLKFAEQMEVFLKDKGLWWDLSSYRLGGSIKYQSNNEPMPMEKMPDLIDEFFDKEVGKLAAIEGAAKALGALHKRADVLIFSNVPHQHALARQENLARHKMDYPLLSGEGPKGPALAWIESQINAPMFFLDDIPFQVENAAEHTKNVRLINLIAHQRLAELAPKCEQAHFSATEWHSTEQWIADELTQKGF